MNEYAKLKLKELAMRTPIGRAVWTARDTCKDNRIGTTCKQGKTRVILTIVKDGGACDIKPLSGWLSTAQAIAFLEEMVSEAQCVS